MYVCLCNRITDRDVRLCAEAECPTVSSVYRSLGGKPRCGKCVPYLRQMIREIGDGPALPPGSEAD